MPYEKTWTNPNAIEQYLQDNLGLREQDIRSIMQDIQFLAVKHWHYNTPGDGGFTENERSWHAAMFYNPLGWNY